VLQPLDQFFKCHMRQFRRDGSDSGSKGPFRLRAISRYAFLIEPSNLDGSLQTAHDASVVTSLDSARIIIRKPYAAQTLQWMLALSASFLLSSLTSPLSTSLVNFSTSTSLHFPLTAKGSRVLRIAQRRSPQMKESGVTGASQSGSWAKPQLSNVF
jgi:hypothetical protein